jgi:uncharacterized protein with FMN-binding domain
MNINKKKVIGFIVIVLLIGGGFFAKYIFSVNSYQAKVKTMEVSNIDLSQIPDGTYVGDCDVEFIYAKVQVTVANGTISDVKLLEHKNERGQSAEVIVNKMIEENTIDVDSVSGATNSSRVIKKAAENALLSAKTQNE